MNTDFSAIYKFNQVSILLFTRAHVHKKRLQTGKALDLRGWMKQ